MINARKPETLVATESASGPIVGFEIIGGDAVVTYTCPNSAGNVTNATYITGEEKHQRCITFEFVSGSGKIRVYLEKGEE